MTEKKIEDNVYEDNVRSLAVKILNRIDRTDAYLDKILESEIRQSELESKDKSLLFEIVHGVVRWMGKLDWILTGFYKGQYIKCIPNIKNAMRVGLYQILFLDKVPEYAAINEAVEFVKKMQGQKAADLTNAVLRAIIRNKSNIRYADRDNDLHMFLSAFYSHPIWLTKRWVVQFGVDFTEELMNANNERPKLTIRTNKLKTNSENLKLLLDSVELKYKNAQFFENFIELNNLTNIADWQYFKNGYFTIQDESTAFSCELLNPSPEDLVLDLCAAPGGKTAYLAEKMNNTGKIIAIDQYDTRVRLMENNFNRLGITNIESIVTNVIEYNPDCRFDKVLADVPCSGLGTLTKKPDIKWKRNLSDIIQLNQLQAQILEKGCSLLKEGGELVYSTCSIDKDENYEIVKAFLNKNDNYEIVTPDDRFHSQYIFDNKYIQTYPHLHRMDGAFAIKIRRKK